MTSFIGVYQLSNGVVICESDDASKLGTPSRTIRVSRSCIDIIKHLLSHMIDHSIDQLGAHLFYKMSVLETIGPILKFIDCEWSTVATCNMSHLPTTLLNEGKLNPLPFIRWRIKQCFARGELDDRDIKLICGYVLANNLTPWLVRNPEIALRLGQQDAVSATRAEFAVASKACINLPCGYGKTFVALEVIKELVAKPSILPFVLICCPTTTLIEQWENVIRFYYEDADADVHIMDRTILHSPSDIQQFCRETSKVVFLIDTYAAALKNAAQYEFGIKIADEAHRSLGNDVAGKRTFSQFHTIVSAHTLFMTATMKYARAHYTMEHQSQYGKLVYVKTIRDGIREKCIVPCHIWHFKHANMVQNPTEPVAHNSIMRAAYAMLQIVNKIFVYVNKCSECDILNAKFRQIYPEIPSFSFHSKRDNTDILSKFKTVPQAVLFCAQKLGEGYDMPQLSGVLFTRHVKSEIKITQYAMRSSRVNIADPGKINYIGIPPYSYDRKPLNEFAAELATLFGTTTTVVQI